MGARGRRRHPSRLARQARRYRPCLHPARSTTSHGHGGRCLDPRASPGPYKPRLIASIRSSQGPLRPYSSLASKPFLFSCPRSAVAIRRSLDPWCSPCLALGTRVDGHGTSSPWRGFGFGEIWPYVNRHRVNAAISLKHPQPGPSFFKRPRPRRGFSRLAGAFGDLGRSCLEVLEWRRETSSTRENPANPAEMEPRRRCRPSVAVGRTGQGGALEGRARLELLGQMR